MSAVDYQISAGANDGYWFDGGYSNSNSVFIGYSDIDCVSFCRFTGVTIPAGSTVTLAYLSFYFSYASNLHASCNIYADDQANPAAVSSENDGASRTKTTNYVAWEAPDDGTWNNTSYVTEVTQELVDSYSYASGSAMQFLLVGTTSDYISELDYDAWPTLASKLHIEYTEAPSGNTYYIYNN